MFGSCCADQWELELCHGAIHIHQPIILTITFTHCFRKTWNDYQPIKVELHWNGGNRRVSCLTHWVAGFMAMGQSGPSKCNMTSEIAHTKKSSDPRIFVAKLHLTSCSRWTALRVSTARKGKVHEPHNNRDDCLFRPKYVCLYVQATCYRIVCVGFLTTFFWQYLTEAWKI